MPNKKAKGFGRPTKLTKALQEKLVRYIKSGLFLHEACALCKVSVPTVEQWIQRGEGKHERPWTQEHQDFVDSLRGAEAELAKEGVTKWRAHFDNDWRSVEKFMQKRFPHTWGSFAGAGAAQAETEFDLSEPDVVDPELGTGKAPEEGS